ncbi:hypothetical protein JL720_14047 [Aureococcus anophagefferens]|nr:hypothetical protein JL720_14047 [Aureococcus anophagefferens]
MREDVRGAAHRGAADGKTLVYNRLLDFGIFVFAALGALEVLSLELGEPLTHLINGLLLTFNDKFQPGEEVKFGDVAGFVTSMGWFDTHVRRYDESTASEIASGDPAARVAGLARWRGRAVVVAVGHDDDGDATAFKASRSATERVAQRREEE